MSPADEAGRELRRHLFDGTARRREPQPEWDKRGGPPPPPAWLPRPLPDPAVHITCGGAL